VYLIDEVHMFSAHSFNALLKTLEEPPPHVKFLLATTDPQKVPVTVLSRCLQLNLKRLVPDEIRDRLAHILAAEGIDFEPQALSLLARAADGSMRDGLSLLDQSIAFGGGHVGRDEVRAMLGTVGRDLCLNLLQALAKLDGPGLLDEVARIAELTPDFAGVLQQLIALLHRIALHQQVPATLTEDDPDRERILNLSGRFAPEDVQLFYQIALMGQQDLPLAPDPRTGIEMVLLRMLAFRPDNAGEPGTKPRREEQGEQPSATDPNAPRGRAAQGQAPPADPATAALAAARQLTVAEGSAANPRMRVSRRPVPESTEGRRIAAPRRMDSPQLPVAEAAAVKVVSNAAASEAETVESGLRGTEDWHRLVAGLGLGGVASQLARNCELAGWDGRRLCLTLDPECRNLQVPVAEERLQGALAEALGAGLRLEIRISCPERETPARRSARRIAERQAQAEALMEDDPVVRSLQDELDARWVPGSIEPTD
jgi:DNA polymerase-3 subunit gamma/tau